MSNIAFMDLLGSEEFKEEFAVAEVQASLSKMMDDKGISRAELARRLNVSRARVTQIFSDEAQNFTLRLLVKSFLALGEEPVIVTRAELNALQSSGEVSQSDKGEPSLSTDGIAEALVAKLLEANLSVPAERNERQQKRLSGTKDWVTSTNVVPFRKTAHG